MKILVASDSYKGCMSSKEANGIIKKAIHDVDEKHEVFTFTVSDGGEGTSEAFVEACNGEFTTCMVKDAYFKNIEVRYGLIDDRTTAVIEVASCIALNSYEREKRKPMHATSYGVGQLLLDAKNKGVKKIILGLGGSSTNDGGMGILQALGVKFYDSEGNYLKSSASSLGNIAKIDLTKLTKFSDVEMIAACDVKNLLLGEQGATYVFGRQKGLYPNQIKNVEKGMINYVAQLAKFGIDLNTYPGGGAAGGIGAIMLGLLGAKCVPGLDLLAEYTNIEEIFKTCDLVITGEGQSDQQTFYGKTPVGILQMANKYKIPCICISGALGKEYQSLYDLGFVGIYSISDRAMGFLEALKLAPEKLYNCAFTVVRTIDYFKEKKE